MCAFAITAVNAAFKSSLEPLEDPINHDFILSFLMFEHIYSYVTCIYRKYDINKNGKPDTNGVSRAPKEFMLQVIQVFVDCFLFGYLVKHLIMMN